MKSQPEHFKISDPAHMADRIADRIAVLRIEARKYMETFDYHFAETSFRQAVQLAQESNDKILLTHCIDDLAQLLYRASKRNLPEIKDLYLLAMSIHEGMSPVDTTAVASLYEKLSAVHDVARRPREAADCLSEAVKIWQSDECLERISPERLEDLRKRASYLYRVAAR